MLYILITGDGKATLKVTSMRVNFSLLYYLKKPKSYQTGPVPIYLKITVAGKRAEVATGRDCEPARWNAAAGRASVAKEAVKVSG